MESIEDLLMAGLALRVGKYRDVGVLSAVLNVTRRTLQCLVRSQYRKVTVLVTDKQLAVSN